MASRRDPHKSPDPAPVNLTGLQRVMEDLEGVERLLLMQLTLLKEMRRRLLEVDRTIRPNS